MKSLVNKNSIMTTKAKVKYLAKTPTTELPSLWQRGFFTEWRTAAMVAGEFAKVACHFRSPALSMALSRAAFLTPKGKGKNLQYIQAYPFKE